MSSGEKQSVSNVAGAATTQTRGAVVPVWLFVVMFVLLYWGAVYFDGAGAWFDARVYAPYHDLEEVQALQPISGAGGVIALGKAVYNRPTCAACHQATGLGSPGQFPPLAGSELVNEPDPGRVIRIVLNGLGGPITVKGQSYNNNMVPWGGPPPSGLTDEEIAAVLTYVRQNKEWGNNAPAVTPAQVKAVRDKIKSRMTPFTVEEIMKISPSE